MLRRNVRTQPYGRCTVCSLRLSQCHAWQSNGWSFALVVGMLALLLVPPGWPQAVLVALLLALVVAQGWVNHRRTDELIFGQHRLVELTQQLRGKQVLIEQHNANLARLHGGDLTLLRGEAEAGSRFMLRLPAAAAAAAA